MTTAHPGPITIGIDPGGRYTGVAMVAAEHDRQQRRELIAARVLTTTAGPLLDHERVSQACAEVLTAIDEALAAAATRFAHVMVDEAPAGVSYLDEGPHLATALAPRPRPATPAELVHYGHLVLAVEGLNAPKGFAGGQRARIDPEGLVATGVILGAVLGRWPSAIVVAPGGNGSNPDITYPDRLRKGARLGGPSTHARSAYDVAVRARFTAAMRATFAAQADTSPRRATPRG